MKIKGQNWKGKVGLFGGLLMGLLIFSFLGDWVDSGVDFYCHLLKIFEYLL